MSYYYTIDGTQVGGPHSLEEILASYREGSLPKTTQICEEGKQEWRSIESLENEPSLPQAAGDFSAPPLKGSRRKQRDTSSTGNQKSDFPLDNSGCAGTLVGVFLFLILMAFGHIGHVSISMVAKAIPSIIIGVIAVPVFWLLTKATSHCSTKSQEKAFACIFTIFIALGLVLFFRLGDTSPEGRLNKNSQDWKVGYATGEEFGRKEANLGHRRAGRNTLDKESLEVDIPQRVNRKNYADGFVTGYAEGYDNYTK